jgi:hypothetical protein
MPDDDKSVYAPSQVLQDLWLRHVPQTPDAAPQTPDEFVDPMSGASKAQLQAGGEAAIGVGRHFAELPQKAFEASENLRQGGSYDPSAVVEASGLLGVGGIGAAERGAVGAFGGKLTEELLPGSEKMIRAYHGSPHDFEKFDISKVGTGEGAQAYGHGLYFAENPAVAEQYKTELANHTVGGEPLDLGNPTHLASALVKDYKSRALALSRSSERLSRDPNNELLGNAIDILKSGREIPPYKTTPGKTYEVNIKSDPEHFFEWEKPLSEQSPKVQQALAKISHPEADEVKTAIATVEKQPKNPQQQLRLKQLKDALNSVTKGPSFYSSVGRGNRRMIPEKELEGIYPEGMRKNVRELSDVAAARVLKEAGIPGIRYLDQGSRAGGKGSYNYVVFDDKTIEILKKYGLAGLGVGLGAEGTGKPDE